LKLFFRVELFVFVFRNLKERQLLTEENEALKAQLREKEAELKNLQKKNELEVKNLKFQLQNEQRKARNAQIETEKCRLEVNAFSKLDQMNASPIIL